MQLQQSTSGFGASKQSYQSNQKPPIATKMTPQKTISKSSTLNTNTRQSNVLASKKPSAVLSNDQQVPSVSNMGKKTSNGNPGSEYNDKP